MTNTNSHNDLVDQIQQLFNDVSPLLASTQSRFYIASTNIETFESSTLQFTFPYPTKAPPYVSRLLPVIPPQARNIMRDKENQGYVPPTPHHHSATSCLDFG